MKFIVDIDRYNRDIVQNYTKTFGEVWNNGFLIGGKINFNCIMIDFKGYLPTYILGIDTTKREETHFDASLLAALWDILN